MSDPLAPHEPGFRIASRYWWVLFVLGLLAIVLGILAIAYPLVASVTYAVWFGAMVAALGAFQIADSFAHRRSGAFWPQLVFGLLALIAGGMVLFFPGAGLISLTLILGWFFILDAALRFWAAFTLAFPSRRLWIILGGVISLLLGLMILTGLPFSASYTIGLLWGIHAIYVGVVLARFGWMLR